jgi:hypothetical protein
MRPAEAIEQEWIMIKSSADEKDRKRQSRGPNSKQRKEKHAVPMRAELVVQVMELAVPMI